MHYGHIVTFEKAEISAMQQGRLLELELKLPSGEPMTLYLRASLYAGEPRTIRGATEDPPRRRSTYRSRLSLAMKRSWRERKAKTKKARVKAVRAA